MRELNHDVIMRNDIEQTEEDIGLVARFRSRRYFRSCLASEEFPETIRRPYTDQQPGTKSARGPANKLRINRSSTAGFVLPSVYIGFPLSVLPETPRRVFFDCWKVRGTSVFWARRSVLPSCPLSPCPAAPQWVAPPRHARGMSRIWIRQVETD